MGKKNKSNNQPNAPELQQILLNSPTNHQQPPHNPYYPDLGSTSYQPPPPYSDLSSPRVYAPHNPMARSSAPSANQTPTVIVQQSHMSCYDRKREKRNRKIRTHNSQMLFLSVVIIVLSIYANKLYENRPCIETFTVHKIDDDHVVRIKDVREGQLNVAYITIFLAIICLAKCGNTNADSHGCYLVFMGLTTFVTTLTTGYLAYLAFYSPCTTNLGQQFQAGAKTLFGALVDKLPSPDQGKLGETNVIQWAQEDKAGFGIFCIDLFNFIIYLSAFISTLSLC